MESPNPITIAEPFEVTNLRRALEDERRNHAATKVALGKNTAEVAAFANKEVAELRKILGDANSALESERRQHESTKATLKSHVEIVLKYREVCNAYGCPEMAYGYEWLSQYLADQETKRDDQGLKILRLQSEFDREKYEHTLTKEALKVQGKDYANQKLCNETQYANIARLQELLKEEKEKASGLYSQRRDAIECLNRIRTLCVCYGCHDGDNLLEFLRDFLAERSTKLANQEGMIEKTFDLVKRYHKACQALGMPADECGTEYLEDLAQRGAILKFRKVAGSDRCLDLRT